MTKSKSHKARKQILDDHKQIGELLSRIVGAATAAESSRCLADLVPLLQRHFREEEAEIDGLHAVIRQRTPQFWNALCGLREEHVKLLAQAGALRTEADRGGDAERLRQFGRALKDSVAAHEARETELFVDSIWTDIGEGD